MQAIRSTLLVIVTLVLATVAAAGIRPVSSVALDHALRDAAKLAEHHPEMRVLRVEGSSMLPYFGRGSVLLVKPANSATLKAGMVVVYTNRFAESVAHRITGGDAITGWVVKGYNNAEADSTRVTSDNLIGTVYATLFAKGVSESTRFTASALALSTPVALAAPAR